MQDLRPLTIHEADVALFQSWPDGRRMTGPLPAHLEATAEAKFRVGLSLTRRASDRRDGAFGDWRHGGFLTGGGWKVEFRQPFGSLLEASGKHVSSLIEPGREFTLLVRFLDEDTGHWHLFQFHHARIGDDLPIAEQNQIAEQSYSFEAAWLEHFRGSNPATLPALEPREWGVVEWEHAGRCVPCHYYNPATGAWLETDENEHEVEGSGAVKYVSIEDDGGGTIELSYLTPRTVTESGPVLDRTVLSWLDAKAANFDAAGITPAPGWQLQTNGCAEPLTCAPSERHWQHPRVRLRFLGRVYATLSHGIIAVPAVTEGAPSTPPLDPEIALHPNVIFLPEGAYVLP